MLGIVGGSGTESERFADSGDWKTVSTEYGPSEVFIGQISGQPVCVISRHGNRNDFNPAMINYRANIAALKSLDCNDLITTTAVGSLNTSFEVGDLLIIDQFIDLTTRRNSTIFEGHYGNKQHTNISEPYCKGLSGYLRSTAAELGYKAHSSATVVTIEGPRFCTRAEAKMFTILGADVINMTSATEAIIANELGIRIATIGLVTDIVTGPVAEGSVSADLISFRLRDLRQKLYAVIRASALKINLGQ